MVDFSLPHIINWFEIGIRSFFIGLGFATGIYWGIVAWIHITDNLIKPKEKGERVWDRGQQI